MFRKATTPPRDVTSAKEASKASSIVPVKKEDVIAECTKQKEAFVKKLKDLIAALKKSQDSMNAHRKAHLEVRLRPNHFYQK